MSKFKTIILLIALIVTVLIWYILSYEKIYKPKTIKLGLSIPKSGIMHTWGDAVYAGSSAYFRYANENRLLDKKIVLTVLDDKYEPDLTLKNTKKLIEKDIFALFGFVGTPTSKKILPTLEDTNTLYIAPFSGASFLRDLKRKNIVNFRSSYYDEIKAIVSYLHTKKNITKFAVFYQNDDYGEEGYVSLIRVLQTHKLKLHGEGAYKRNTLSITHALREIKKSNPEAILMVGANKANVLFIKAAQKEPELKNTIFCSISFGDADEMIKSLKNQKQNLLFSTVVPFYQKKSVMALTEYQNIMKKYHYENYLGFISLEAFLAAKTVVKSLQSIKGSLTKNKFIKSITTLPVDTLNGIPITYKNHQLLNHVYLFSYQNDKFNEIIDAD